MVSSDQRRRQLAREKYERQQQRRAAQRKARRRNAVIASALAVVLAGGAAAYATGALSGDDGDKTDSTVADATPSSTPSKAPDPCAKPAPGAIKELSYKKEPALTIDKSASYTMKLQTTCGDITLGLNAAKAPRTVNSFNFLAAKGYFDHTKCHRLTTSGIYVLQCGDPTAQGSGSPGYKLPDENLKDPKLKGGVYPAGTVAMANAGANTGGSQFFLVYQDSKLPPSYTPFGTIKGGQDVLKKIAGAGEATGRGDGAPNATVVIDKATVTK